MSYLTVKALLMLCLVLIFVTFAKLTVRNQTRVTKSVVIGLGISIIFLALTLCYDVFTEVYKNDKELDSMQEFTELYGSLPEYIGYSGGGEGVE